MEMDVRAQKLVILNYSKYLKDYWDCFKTWHGRCLYIGRIRESRAYRKSESAGGNR